MSCINVEFGVCKNFNYLLFLFTDEDNIASGPGEKTVVEDFGQKIPNQTLNLLSHGHRLNRLNDEVSYKHLRILWI
jgi:hypothetical protein